MSRRRGNAEWPPRPRRAIESLHESPRELAPRTFSRRQVLLGGAGIAAATGGGVWYVSRSEPPKRRSARAIGAPASTVAPSTTRAPLRPFEADTTLVVIRLAGGNDAFNTLISPTGPYYAARPTLAVKDSRLIKVPGRSDLGLHPALAPIQPLLDSGRVGIVAGVGFDPGSRSHSRSKAMWATGRTDGSGDGWLGRWLGIEVPSATSRAARSLLLGAAAQETRGSSPRSVRVEDLVRFRLAEDVTTLDSAVQQSWSALSSEHATAFAAANALRSLPVDLSVDDDVAADSRSLLSRMRSAAQLINVDAGCRIVVVTAEGFDTHANQGERHAALLGDLAKAIVEFQRIIGLGERAKKVMLITTSEFGRRLAENGSRGTDHGGAGVQLMVSAALSDPELVGAIDLADLDDGGLRPAVDPRTIFATALDWLEGEQGSSRTDQLLDADGIERLPWL